jgi:hypothetical protein
VHAAPALSRSGPRVGEHFALAQQDASQCARLGIPSSARCVPRIRRVPLNLLRVALAPDGAHPPVSWELSTNAARLCPLPRHPPGLSTRTAATLAPRTTAAMPSDASLRCRRWSARTLLDHDGRLVPEDQLGRGTLRRVPPVCHLFDVVSLSRWPLSWPWPYVG